MKVFVTGASGFVGTAVVQELLNNGYEVLGLARSAESAAKLNKLGAEVHGGDLEDLESLRRGAAVCDKIIHCGFIHDFTRFAEVCAIDEAAIKAMAEVGKPMVVTSGTALVSPGSLATEEMASPFNPGWPRASERADSEAMVLRLPPSVHGEGDRHGFVPMLVNLAKEQGFSAYIGEGQNRWNAGHRLDAAVLYRLALEKGKPGERFHAAAEEGIAMRDIAEAIGKRLGLPVKSVSVDEAGAHFGWFAHMAGLDCPASSALTQACLGWQPVQQTLIADIAAGIYDL
ncbi:SDR family oxidoreductase [Mucilaginibacter segetis]|uniref:SDR family oxidoreductase n=1 Tax=Mucilaginibacter segetis TaxID=2793071 RepID=A0A934PUJ4_9SPHI|nr:SDR family oxidoreductase [Mucilaginibacter segetis]MBK0379355.1 SDR family oxidoreductase [Mucilaginibacter segetis]